MALRMLEIYLPSERSDEIRDILEQDAECACLGLWQYSLSDGQSLVKTLIDSAETEAAIDALNKRFSSLEGFRLVLLAVEATLPRPEPPPEEEEPSIAAEEEAKARRPRISREELYADVSDQTRLSGTFLALVTLSSIVAAVGLLNDNVAVIIGAMVIAPLLGPNVALSLATTLGDIDLARRALQVNAAGLLAAMALSILTGAALPVDPGIPQIAGRTEVGVGEIVLALASGGAGALSFTMGLSTAVVGVMVAVALLPPLVTLGMLLGAALWTAALGALLLLLTNVICVNLAGVITFLAQGIRPTWWWEEQQAKRATRRALLVWLLLLALLLVVIVLSQRG